MKRKLNFINLFLIFILLFAGLPVSAAEEENDLKNYVIDDSRYIAVPETYTYQYSINTVSSINGKNSFLSQPSDLFIDSQGFLFVADTKNNRVVKLNKNGNLICEFKSYGKSPLNKPEGVFVKEDGTIYIADTGSSRIIELTADGEPIKEFGLPKSELLADVTVYSPSKLVVTRMGEIYVLMGENIMNITEDNEFTEYFGQTDIGFDLIEWFVRKFASAEQQKSLTKRNAASYTNICLDKSGLIYATSRDTTEGQIKALNTVGNNIYRKLGSASGGFAAISNFFNKKFSGNVISKSFIYGEKNDKNKEPEFSDICVDDNDIVSVVENKNGKLYQYDSLGRLLCVFGGLGSNQGEFSIPTSIEIDDEGNIYVLDASYGNIAVFAPTDFIKLVQTATVAYSKGDYNGANKLWNEVLKIDKTYPLANLGIGNTRLKKDDYKGAMESYKLSNDRLEYSKAFVKQRDAIIENHFSLVAIFVIITIVLLGAVIVIFYKKSDKVLEDFEYNRVSQINFSQGLWLSIGMIFKPGRVISAIKEGRGKIKLSSSLFILICVFITRIVFIYTVSYPLQDIEIKDVNLALEFLKLILPIITWIGMNYLISEQFGGEQTLTETFITGCYSMVPYIIINLFASALSHVMCWQEKGIFAVLVNGVVVWCVILLLKSCRRMNDFTIRHTIFVALITVAAMILVWFVTLFGYSLIMCLKQFFSDILQEIRLMNA